MSEKIEIEVRDLPDPFDIRVYRVGDGLELDMYDAYIVPHPGDQLLLHYDRPVVVRSRQFHALYEDRVHLYVEEL